MLATISGQALAGTAAPKAQYWRAATGRSDHQAVRAFQCYRSADGDTDDGAQCAPLSWRTEIQRLIRTTLNGSDDYLVGLPLGSKESAPAWAWKLGRSLKVPVGDRHDSDVGSPSADPIKILREGGCFSWRPLFLSTTVSLFGAPRVEIRPRIRLVRWLHTSQRDSSQRHWVRDSI